MELTGDIAFENAGTGMSGYDLALFYYALGEYGKCLETRKQIYELTGDVQFTPTEYTIEEDNNGIHDTRFYNQYGNLTVSTREGDGQISESVNTYGDNGRVSRYDRSGDDGGETVVCLYDADGRLIETKHEPTFSGMWMKVDVVYQYDGKNVIYYYHEEESDGDVYDPCYIYEMDKYGTMTFLGDYSGNNLTEQRRYIFNKT